jgi:CheY-like chemotaxis protein
VDDNRDALVVLADWFTLEGHDVSTADSAERALELLQGKHKRRPSTPASSTWACQA